MLPFLVEAQEAGRAVHEFQVGRDGDDAGMDDEGLFGKPGGDNKPGFSGQVQALLVVGGEGVIPQVLDFSDNHPAVVDDPFRYVRLGDKDGEGVGVVAVFTIFSRFGDEVGKDGPGFVDGIEPVFELAIADEEGGEGLRGHGIE